MDRLRTLLEARQIDMTLVVYPWPGHFRVRDRGSRHVPHWRDWANRNHVRFVDLFAALVDPASDLETLVEIYIPGDVHFSAEGHRRVAALLMTAGVGGRVPAARTSPE
jgi:lysophospholipase L1-like esterase